MFINLSGCTVDNVRHSLMEAAPSAEQWDAWATELQQDASSLDHRRPAAGMLRAAILDKPDDLVRCVQWTWNHCEQADIWQSFRRLTRMLIIGSDGGTLHNFNAHFVTRLRELVKLWNRVVRCANEDSDDSLRFIRSRVEKYNLSACTAVARATAAMRCVATPVGASTSESGAAVLSARFSTSSTILDPDAQSVSSETLSSQQMFPSSSGDSALTLWDPESLREHVGAASSELRHADLSLRRVDVAVGFLQRSLEFDARASYELHETLGMLREADSEVRRTQSDLRSEEVLARVTSERQDIIARRTAAESKIEVLRKKHLRRLDERSALEAQIKAVNETISELEASLRQAEDELADVATLEARHKLRDGPLDRLQQQHQRMEHVSRALSCTFRFVEALQTAAAHYIEPHIRVHREELHEAWSTGLRSCTTLFQEIHQVVVNVARASEKLRGIGTSTGQSVVHPLRRVGERVAQHYYVAQDKWRTLQVLRDRIRSMAVVNPEIDGLVDGSTSTALWQAALVSYGEIESLFPTAETPTRQMPRSSSNTSNNDLLLSTPQVGERPVLPPKLMQRKGIGLRP